jgi:hypothetical protein
MPSDIALQENTTRDRHLHPERSGHRGKAEQPRPTDAQIAAMSGPEKFAECLRRAIENCPKALQQQLSDMVQPAALATAGAIFAGGIFLAASTPVGWASTIAGIMTLAGVTLSCLPLAWDLQNAGVRLMLARTNADIDMAASYLTDFVVGLGFEAFGAFMAKAMQLGSNAVKAASAAAETERAAFVSRRLSLSGDFGKGPKPRSRNLMEAARIETIAQRAGYTTEELSQLMLQAKMTNKVGIYRVSNPKRLSWTAQRFPQKPLFVKAKTSESIAGFARCKSQKEVKEVLDAGYYVVKEEKGQWTLLSKEGVVVDGHNQLKKLYLLEDGVVIDPESLKPFIGDIDGYDTFSFSDFAMIVTRKIEEVRGSAKMSAWVNDSVTKAIRMINGRMGKGAARNPMQHGYHFGSGFDPADAGELVIVLPNGVVIFEESKKLMEIYKQMNRWAVILN